MYILLLYYLYIIVDILLTGLLKAHKFLLTNSNGIVYSYKCWHLNIVVLRIEG